MPVRLFLGLLIFCAPELPLGNRVSLLAPGHPRRAFTCPQRHQRCSPLGRGSPFLGQHLAQVLVLPHFPLSLNLIRKASIRFCFPSGGITLFHQGSRASEANGQDPGAAVRSTGGTLGGAAPAHKRGRCSRVEVARGSLRSLNFSTETPTEISRLQAPLLHRAPPSRTRSSPRPRPQPVCALPPASVSALSHLAVLPGPTAISFSVWVQLQSSRLRLTLLGGMCASSRSDYQTFLFHCVGRRQIFPRELSPVSFIHFILCFSPFPPPAFPPAPLFFFPDSSFPLQFHHLSCPLSPCPFRSPCAL